MKLINIGFGNMVNANRLVAIVSPESAPIKRIIQDCKERGTLTVSYTHLDVYKRQPHGNHAGERSSPLRG